MIMWKRICPNFLPKVPSWVSRFYFFPFHVIAYVTLPICLYGCIGNSVPGEVLAASKVSAIKADAGPSQTSMIGQTVVLNCLGSSLVDGEPLSKDLPSLKDVMWLVVLNDVSADPLSFQWAQISGPPITLESPTCPITMFVGQKEGIYVFKLTIRNRMGCDEDTVEIVISPIPTLIPTQMPITAAPVISPDVGEFTGSTEISIACATEGATIYFTVDGSEPGPASVVYREPLRLTATTTIKARAGKAGLTDSDVVTATFTGQVIRPSFASSEGNIPNSTTVTLSCATDGATVYYTLDGSEPGPASAVYHEPISLTATTTIKARAGKAGLTDSDVVTATFTAGRVASPSFGSNEGTVLNSTTVTLSCPTQGATIYYTLDGSQPGPTSLVYRDPISLTATTTVTAMAVKAGLLASQVVTATVTTGHVAIPSFTSDDEDFTATTTMTLSCSTEGAIIYYTLDGSEPNSSSSVYSVPIPLLVTTTIKAMAAKAGRLNSQVATTTLTRRVMSPMVNPTINEGVTFMDLSITCGTVGSTIYYTLDGSPPTLNSPVYGGPIHLTYSTIIRTLAVKAGLTDSAVVSKTITILPSLTRASLEADGTQGNGISQTPVSSADGRYIAFTSSATNLVAGDTNTVADVFVRDRQTGLTTRISASSTGIQGNGTSQTPSISADGRYVAFVSTATNLVTGDSNAAADIFVHDRQTVQTTRVSLNSDGTQGNSACAAPSISGDGRYVAYYSSATNLVTGDTNGYNDIFVYDRQTAQTTRVSVSSTGVQATNASVSPVISADGRYVAYVSTATNLVTGDTNAYNDIFVYDRQTAQTTRISVSSTGVQATNASLSPSVSEDGRYVAYVSTATNLVTGDTNGYNDIFVYDRQTAQTTRISVSSTGAQATNASSFPSISADGRYVAFVSTATNLVTGDTNGYNDIFLYDRQMAQTTRITARSDGTQANNASLYPRFSSNGRYIAFQSNASNLVDADGNAVTDVFIFDRGP